MHVLSSFKRVVISQSIEKRTQHALDHQVISFRGCRFLGRVQDLLCLTIICSLLLSRIDFQITNHQASIKPNVKINDPLSLQACRWPCRGEWGIAEKDMLEEQTRAALFTHFSLPSALTTPISHYDASACEFKSSNNL